MKGRIRWAVGGGVIALAVSLVALAGTPGADATQGQAVTAGVDNSETRYTSLYNTSAGFSASTCAPPTPVALAACGQEGVRARGTFAGVWARGGELGVHGESDSSTGTGVHGSGGNGLHGEGTENGVFAQGGTFGVFAEGDEYGVYARAPVHGVYGAATSAFGAGVEAEGGVGTALRVHGKAQFSRSGAVSVAGTSSAPKNSVRVNLTLTSKSMITATLQRYRPGVFVVAAVPNVAGGYFTVYLNKAVTATVGPIAWIVTERP